MDTILCGDALEVLRGMADQSVNCCVTSPPYWGLRDYGTAEWEGGDPGCQHTISAKDADNKAVFNERVTRGNRDRCVKCGAIRVDHQFGLEETPEEYVESIVEVFREVRRVLRDDGTVWLNLGDSYASGKGTCYNPGGGKSSLGKERKDAGAHPLDRGNKSTLAASGLKPKDLVGIPWRVAFALQADGWWLRSDIIWAKPNPMPESVRDRCTKSHEYIFMLSKSKKYYYDADAIKEPSVYPNDKRRPLGSKGAWEMDGREQRANGGGVAYEHDTLKRNKRDVWKVTTKPFKGAHFAVFPPDLIRPCVLAGCPKGGTVLDPFFGAGTTGMVAKQEGRKYIGIELNPEYAEMAKNRIHRECSMDRLI